ncbi:MAG TPA: hypothetical protein VIM57_10225 [Luteolibacter sp.]
MNLYHVARMVVGGLLLSSCASVKKAGSSLAAFSPGDLMPARVKVVEVREKDLREIPSGKERAIAYTANKQAVAKRDSGFWNFFRGPVDFKEPALPAGGSAMEDGLLPPKIN